MKPDHHVAVIGAGFSGIGAAIKLDEAGIHDFLVIERSDGVGGAWHSNTYPGVAVDIPSFSYSFSFEQNPFWSRVFAPGKELKTYAEHCVDKYRLRSRIKLNTTVEEVEFDEGKHFWRIHTATGDEITARYIVTASGFFSQPKRPDIVGIDDFSGTLMHTSQWDHTQKLAGKRVAVIGTGASALQVIPAIADEVKHLTVFQRTPIWVLPKPDAELSRPMQSILRFSPARLGVRLTCHALIEATLVLTFQYYRRLPVIAKSLEHLCRAHLRRQVPDPVLRAKLTPDYRFGCKRPSLSNTYLRSFTRDDVDLEVTPIDCITPDGVQTTDGKVHEADILILATGFKVFETGSMPAYPTKGVSGRDLDEFWKTNRYQAYQGVSVPGFPNLFTILGPYGFNGSSYFQLIETQSNHIVRLITEASRRNAVTVDVTQAANDRYFNTMLSRRDATLFFNAPCGSANSYYYDANGDVPIRACTTPETHWRAKHFNFADYHFGYATEDSDQVPSASVAS